MNGRESVHMNYLRWLLQVLIGSVFVFSAYSKMIMSGLIEIILVDHGFFRDRASAAFFVRLLIAGELAIGLLFFQKNFLKQIVIPASLLFLILFTSSNFPYAMITAKEFFDLIGNSPLRLYWIKNGEIKEIWDKDFYEKLSSTF